MSYPLVIVAASDSRWIDAVREAWEEVERDDQLASKRHDPDADWLFINFKTNESRLAFYKHHVNRHSFFMKPPRGAHADLPPPSKNVIKFSKASTEQHRDTIRQALKRYSCGFYPKKLFMLVDFETDAQAMFVYLHHRDQLAEFEPQDPSRRPSKPLPSSKPSPFKSSSSSSSSFSSPSPRSLRVRAPNSLSPYSSFSSGSLHDLYGLSDALPSSSSSQSSPSPPPYSHSSSPFSSLSAAPSPSRQADLYATELSAPPSPQPIFDPAPSTASAASIGPSDADADIVTHYDHFNDVKWVTEQAQSLTRAHYPDVVVTVLQSKLGTVEFKGRSKVVERVKQQFDAVMKSDERRVLCRIRFGHVTPQFDRNREPRLCKMSDAFKPVQRLSTFSLHALPLLPSILCSLLATYRLHLTQIAQDNQVTLSWEEHSQSEGEAKASKVKKNVEERAIVIRGFEQGTRKAFKEICALIDRVWYNVSTPASTEAGEQLLRRASAAQCVAKMSPVFPYQVEMCGMLADMQTACGSEVAAHGLLLASNLAEERKAVDKSARAEPQPGLSTMDRVKGSFEAKPLSASIDIEPLLASMFHYVAPDHMFFTVCEGLAVQCHAELRRTKHRLSLSARSPSSLAECVRRIQEYQAQLRQSVVLKEVELRYGTWMKDRAQVIQSQYKALVQWDKNQVHEKKIEEKNNEEIKKSTEPSDDAPFNWKWQDEKGILHNFLPEHNQDIEDAFEDELACVTVTQDSRHICIRFGNTSSQKHHTWETFDGRIGRVVRRVKKQADKADNAGERKIEAQVAQGRAPANGPATIVIHVAAFNEVAVDNAIRALKQAERDFFNGSNPSKSPSQGEGEGQGHTEEGEGVGERAFFHLTLRGERPEGDPEPGHRKY